MSSKPYSGRFPLISPARKVLVTPHPQLQNLKLRGVPWPLFTEGAGDKEAASSLNTSPRPHLSPATVQIHC